MNEIFDEVVMQVGRSPDTNGCDAALFPLMDRVQQANLTDSSREAIRESTLKAWDLITPGCCRRIANRVRRNMKKIIAQQGGNFFSESTSRKIDLKIDPPCVVCTSTYAADSGKHAMIFCEKCDLGSHVSCAKLQNVPRGAWFCENCTE